MQSFLNLIAMIGGIAMAVVVPLLLVRWSDFDKPDSLFFMMIVSVVSIACGLGLCRLALLAAAGKLGQTGDDAHDPPGAPR
jgi:hypothetical protein